MNSDKIRKFESGALRDTSNGKFEYFGFMHPLADYSFAKYMDAHRKMPDGSLRNSNNWWAGFGKDVVMQSLCRHVEDLKLLQAGYHLYELRIDGNAVRKIVEIDGLPDKNSDFKYITIEECCNAIRFNADAFKMEELLHNR